MCRACGGEWIGACCWLVWPLPALVVYPVRSTQPTNPANQISQSDQPIRSANQISQSDQPIRSANQISQSDQPIRSGLIELGGKALAVNSGVSVVWFCHVVRVAVNGLGACCWLVWSLPALVV
ncbi:hypothetical protein JX580_02315 [Thiomicrospira microaerophila]|uniref:hypothetical protein n=1 Tax=Thiomicrospira microaerophila TaxID=406020 RepID=UPI00200F1510|nr:hypothetical protein [Thiomicrospira microaerophila]UQB42752.1 hypothetical protein JX580_02315 [Thiomicrospira microaerophila]